MSAVVEEDPEGVVELEAVLETAAEDSLEPEVAASVVASLAREEADLFGVVGRL